MDFVAALKDSVNDACLELYLKVAVETNGYDIILKNKGSNRAVLLEHVGNQYYDVVSCTYKGAEIIRGNVERPKLIWLSAATEAVGLVQEPEEQTQSLLRILSRK